MAEKQGSKKEVAETREERTNRLKRILHDRGEDAAKVLKAWLQQAQEEGK